MKIAINGFGRIGRAAFKILLEKSQSDSNIEVVAINDLGSPEVLSYLLKHDTVYGTYEKEVSFKERTLVVDGKKYPVYSIKDPSELPWRDLSVDVVLECTGVFRKAEGAKKHLSAGAKKVVLSAPAKDSGFETVVLGASRTDYSNQLFANESCTTNCVAPVIRVLSTNFGIEKSLLTTVHAYTASQSLVDAPNEDNFREGRTAAQNLIPTTTGAAKATSHAVTEVENIFDGIAIRVPVVCGSISDITAVLKRDVTVKDVNNAFKEAEGKNEFKQILKYTEEPIVSSDIIKSPYSSIVDGAMTRVVGGNLVKVLAWYDNEWGYSNRLAEVAIKVALQSATTLPNADGIRTRKI